MMACTIVEMYFEQRLRGFIERNFGAIIEEFWADHL
jgi:hypothetical protein